jgi:hypothetical protein
MPYLDTPPADDNRRILSLIAAGQPAIAALLMLGTAAILFQAHGSQRHSTLTIERGGVQGGRLTYTAGGWRQGVKTVEVPLADVIDVSAKVYNRFQRGATGQVLVKTHNDATMVFNGDDEQALAQAGAIKAFLADPARTRFERIDDNTGPVAAVMGAALLLLIPGLVLFPFRSRRLMLERTPEALRLVRDGKATDIAWDDFEGIAHDPRTGQLALVTREGDVPLLPVPLIERLTGPNDTSRRRGDHVERRVRAFLEPVRATTLV